MTSGVCGRDAEDWAASGEEELEVSDDLKTREEWNGLILS